MTNEKRQMTNGKCSHLLREDRRLTPADRFPPWKPVLMNDAEVVLRLADHLLRRMALEAEQDLEKLSCESRVYGQVQQVTTGRDYPRKLIQSVRQRHVF